MKRRKPRAFRQRRPFKNRNRRGPAWCQSFIEGFGVARNFEHREGWWYPVRNAVDVIRSRDDAYEARIEYSSRVVGPTPPFVQPVVA